MNSSGENDFIFEEVSGSEIEPWLEDLGRLRIAVFREFPYLYDGDLDYEKKYLRTYVESERSVVVLLKCGDELVGATTGLPMADEGPEFQVPFLKAGYDLDEIFYFGESVILHTYRGAGAGTEFIRRRETHSRKVGPFRYTSFCAVDRPEAHPAMPSGYRPLHGFWSRMGYQRQPQLRCEFSWKEIGESEETPKPLTFWLKEWK